MACRAAVTARRSAQDGVQHESAATTAALGGSERRAPNEASAQRRL